MDDLIDRRALLEELNSCDFSSYEDYSRVFDMIDYAPTVESKRGKVETFRNAAVIMEEADFLYSEADNIITNIIRIRLSGKENEIELAENHLAMESFLCKTMQFISWLSQQLESEIDD